jgi:hypothetical protein
VFQNIWNISLRSKAFREVVTALMGTEPLEGRSLKELVGRPARVTITHNEGESQTYANITSVRALKPGTPRPRTPEELVYFSLSPEEFDERTLATLPTRMREKISLSPTYKETLKTLAAKKMTTKELVDDMLPF